MLTYVQMEFKINNITNNLISTAMQTHNSYKQTIHPLQTTRIMQPTCCVHSYYISHNQKVQETFANTLNFNTFVNTHIFVY